MASMNKQPAWLCVLGVEIIVIIDKIVGLKIVGSSKESK